MSLLVSVYIPTKNRFSLVCRAIDSVLDQDYRYIEIVVVDDFSTDSTFEKLNEKYHESISLYQLKKPSGACAARNFAITKANGHFVLGLDDDDFMLPNRVSKFVSAWDPKYSFICSKSRFSSLPVHLLISVFSVFNGYNRSYKYLDLIDQNYAGNQVFTLLERLKEENFDVRFPALQDYELWYRLSKRYGPFVVLNKATQVVDNLHGYSRITNYDRRIEGFNIFCEKHGIDRDVINLHQTVWRIEFRQSTFDDLIYFVKSKKMLMALKVFYVLIFCKL